MANNHSDLDSVDDSSNSYMYISLHILIPTLIIVLALIGNVSVIFVFTKKKMTNGSNNFIIAFSALDILSVILIAPQVGLNFIVAKFGFHYVIRREIVFVLVNFTIISNVLLLSTVAIDRAWAIYSPFTYASNKRRHRRSIIAILSVSVFQTSCQGIFRGYYPLIVLISPIQIVICFIIIFVTYSAIIYKLCRRGISSSKVHHKRVSVEQQAPSGRDVPLASSNVTQTSGRHIQTEETNLSQGKNAQTSGRNILATETNLSLDTNTQTSGRNILATESNVSQDTTENIPLTSIRVTRASGRNIQTMGTTLSRDTHENT